MLFGNISRLLRPLSLQPVATPDAVLVSHRAVAQDVKKIVEDWNASSGTTTCGCWTRNERRQALAVSGS